MPPGGPENPSPVRKARSSRPIKRSTVFLLGHLVLLAVAGSLAHARSIFLDDAFITFRYAANLAAGRGLVYNPGQAFLGTSTPLYALLLGAGSRLTGLDVLEMAAAVHFAALAGLALAAWRLLEGRPLRPLAVLFPYLLIANPLVRLAPGMESLLFVALALLAILQFQRNRPVGLGVAVALLCLTRPDGIVLAGILLGWRWAADHRFPGRAAAAAAGVALPWVIYATAAYGSPVPSTVGAKYLQSATGLWEQTYLNHLVRDVLGRPGNLWWGLAAVAAGVALWRRDRLGLVVSAWLVAHNALFAAAGVPGYHWYYITPLAQVAFLAVHLATGLPAGRWIGRGRWNPAVAAGALATAGALAFVVPRIGQLENPLVRFRAENLAPRGTSYYLIGHWLKENTPPDATVAAIEVGILGYYAERPIVDLLGLVTPGVADKVPDRANIDEVMTRCPPDYFLGNQPLQGHDVNALQYFDRGYDVLLNLSNRLLLKRKDWDETWLARRAAPLVRQAGVHAVYFADFPWILDFHRFQARMAGLAPGVRFNRSFTAANDHVLELEHDGRMKLVAFTTRTAVRISAPALAGWRRIGLAAVEPGDRGLRLVARTAYAHLVGALELAGPFRRFRLRMRVEDLGGRRGGDGRLVCTTRRPDGRLNTFRLVFTVRQTAAPEEVVVRIPGPGIPADATLTRLRLEVLDRPGTLTLEEMILERL